MSKNSYLAVDGEIPVENARFQARAVMCCQHERILQDQPRYQQFGPSLAQTRLLRKRRARLQEPYQHNRPITTLSGTAHKS